MSTGRGKIKPEDGVPFVAGDKRINRKGRPRKLPNLDKLLIVVLGENVNGEQALKSILIALRKKATSGDVRATELLLDRAYGKLKQSTDVSLDFDKLTDDQLNQVIEKLIINKSDE
jgi:hypothetical protein